MLRRVERASKLGGWSYEVYDCKLACETKATTILQLSLYSELLASIQGLLPESMYVIPPGVDFHYSLHGPLRPGNLWPDLSNGQDDVWIVGTCRP